MWGPASMKLKFKLLTGPLVGEQPRSESCSRYTKNSRSLWITPVKRKKAQPTTFPTIQQYCSATDPGIKQLSNGTSFSSSQHKTRPAGGERPVTYPSAWAACLFIRRARDNNPASTLLTAAVQTLCHAARLLLLLQPSACHTRHENTCVLRACVPLSQESRLIW